MGTAAKAAHLAGFCNSAGNFEGEDMKTQHRALFLKWWDLLGGSQVNVKWVPIHFNILLLINFIINKININYFIINILLDLKEILTEQYL